MQAYLEIVNRLFPTVDTTRIHLALSPEQEKERYLVRSEGDQLVIEAGSASAVGVGINRWLQETAHAHVSFLDSQPGLLADDHLPLPDHPLTGEAWAPVRYAINYCFFSYSAAYWDWPEWERLIDWMALQGVNMPLAVTGQEAVWERVFRRLDLPEASFDEFVTGPAYLPFGWMGCMDGYTGPLPANWVSRRLNLGQRIIKRERELGMTPVLQGFTGHIPEALLERHPSAAVQRIHWVDWDTLLLDPFDPLFSRVASIFLEEQSKLFGSDHLYAADPFVEMVPPSKEPAYLAALSRSILSGMTDHDPQARWIMQGWCFKHMEDSWSQQGIDAFLGAIPDEHILVLDLACEERPMYLETDGFARKPWVWGNVLNYGGTVHLSGGMEANTDGLASARASEFAGKLEGIGLINEGLGVNPAAFDYLFEQAWLPVSTSSEAWAKEYSVHRYGIHKAAAVEAWRLLANSVYRGWHLEDSGVTKSPALDTSPPPQERTAAVLAAWDSIVAASDELGTIETFRFDLINVTRQVISNRITVLKAQLRSLLPHREMAEFRTLSATLQTLLADLDGLLAFHPYFRLDSWLSQAERWGSTRSEKEKLRSDALRQITVWALNRRLLDYARKEWSGLIDSFYAPRWDSWIRMVLDAWESGGEPDEQQWQLDQERRERNWVDAPVVSVPSADGDLIRYVRALHERFRSIH